MHNYLNLNQLGRYCDSHLKVVKSRIYSSTQVKGCSVLHTCIRYKDSSLYVCTYMYQIMVVDLTVTHSTH